VFADTEYFKVLLPGPLPPEMMLIQGTALREDQLQVEMAVTLTVAEPPAEVKDRFGGVMEVMHDVPA
jgi:hypothetical protein